MKQIVITVGEQTFKASLYYTLTTNMIWKILPVEGSAIVWGDEVYFEIPVSVDQEPDARADVRVGELAYWPVGRAFCIFYGPTPISSGEKPRAYSPVNVIGEILDDATRLRGTQSGAAVRVIRDVIA